MTPLRLAVCMPIYRTVEAQTALCLARLVRYEAERGTHVEVLGAVGSQLCWNRSELAAKAIELHTDWLLWIDSDMTFPEDAAEHLVAAGHDVIGANCLYRDGSRFTASKYGKPVVTRRDSTGNESCDLLGFGVTLVRTQLFEKASRPWFDTLDTGAERVGEDHYFFTKLRTELDVRPHISHDLSKLVGHIGSAVYVGVYDG